MTPVTKTFFPPLENYNNYLKRIWENEWLTNRGELVNDLETKLKNFLQVQYLTLTTNGTLPLQIALKVLAAGGEVITTPFSYVATTSSIVWENCTPIFVDINEKFLTIDETKIEQAISSRTTAILATHVFGNPCDVEAIEKIAKRYNIKVIYDAAHCFGVDYKGQSIFNYGDVSTCSFHATKIFHTGEGGAMISNDASLHEKLYYGHNFGHQGPTNFKGLGINAKMSELQAAMGLSVFPFMEEIYQERSKVVQFYNENLNFFSFRNMQLRPGTEWNFSYYPVIFNEETILHRVVEKLNKEEIFPRRYFYPSLNRLNYLPYKQCKTSEEISSKILCLPLYYKISPDQLQRIVQILNQTSIEK